MECLTDQYQLSFCRYDAPGHGMANVIGAVFAHLLERKKFNRRRLLSAEVFLFTLTRERTTIITNYLN